MIIGVAATHPACDGWANKWGLVSAKIAQNHSKQHLGGRTVAKLSLESCFYNFFVWTCAQIKILNFWTSHHLWLSVFFFFAILFAFLFCPSVVSFLLVQKFLRKCKQDRKFQWWTRMGWNGEILSLKGSLWVLALSNSINQSISQSINQSIFYLAWWVRLSRASFQVRHEIKN